MNGNILIQMQEILVQGSFVAAIVSDRDHQQQMGID